MKRNQYKYHKIYNDNNPNNPKIINDGNVIHHIDGDSENNNPDNLCKMKISEHLSLHHKDKNLTDITKHKISKTRIEKQLSKDKNHPMYGKNHTEEAKRKMSESHKGKMLSENHKRKISQNHANFKGGNHPQSKLTQMTVDWIRDILDSEEYKEGKKKHLINQTKLAKLFGVKQSVISNIKNNKKWIKNG